MTYQDDLQRNARIESQEEQRRIAAANQNSAVARVVHIVYFLFSVLELLLAIRILLHAIGANPSNIFANLVYQLTQPFANVFLSLFQNPQLSQTAVLEITTMIAILAYAFLGWLTGQIVWLIFSRPR